MNAFGIKEEEGSGIKKTSVFNPAENKNKKQSMNWDLPVAEQGPTVASAGSALGASASQVAGALSQQPSAVTPEMRTPLLGSGALSADAVMPPSATPATGPVAPTAGKPGWLNPFIAAMGAVGQQFAQTPGQLSAGRMLMQHGQSEMEREREDAAAKLAGFDSKAHMSAEEAKAKITNTQAMTKLHEAEAVKSMKSIELMAVQGEKLGWDVKKMRRDFETGTPIPFDMGDGKITLMEPEAGYKLKMDMDKTKAMIQRYATENKLTDAQVTQMFDTTEFMGMQLPKVKVGEWRTELEKSGIAARAHQYSADKHVEAARISANARSATERGLEKLDAKAWEDLVTGAMKHEQILMDPTTQQMNFTKDPKTGATVVKPEKKYVYESFAATLAPLLQSPFPQHKLHAQFKLNQLLDMRAISTQDYNMLLKGETPGPAIPAPVEPGTPKPSVATPLGGKVVMPPAFSKPPEVPYGKTEKALEEAIPWFVPGYGLYKAYETAGKGLGRVYNDVIDIQKINKGAK